MLTFGTFIKKPKKMGKEDSKSTLGEDRVRVSFNVQGQDTVALIKKRTAELINDVNEIKDRDPRLAALAMTAYEEAAMWAVKLATTPKKP